MMPKSMVPFCTLGQRAAKPCLNSSILLSSPNVALATSFATSMSKPTSSPLSSMKPNGGASLVTPTISLPRARTSSSLERPDAAGCWAAAGGACASTRPAPAMAPETRLMNSRLELMMSPPVVYPPLDGPPGGGKDPHFASLHAGYFITSLRGDRSVADGERTRLAYVHLAREAVDRAPNRNVKPPDDILDLGLGDDQRRRETEIMLHRDRDDAFERGVVTDALRHH